MTYVHKTSDNEPAQILIPLNLLKGPRIDLFPEKQRNAQHLHSHALMMLK